MNISARKTEKKDANKYRTFYRNNSKQSHQDFCCSEQQVKEFCKEIEENIEKLTNKINRKSST
ncbi:CLUMA_CG006656, isoform A [Clunio marinus]|uniref:CLUMA_CG006656, isoform A n=1 Tax=Clunio marinus TaxID=568069 RepID=A0A1J1HY35_9DIPT|nr:CLUMA_CG006656, isoform A [Clunio marinus]